MKKLTTQHWVSFCLFVGLWASMPALAQTISEQDEAAGTGDINTPVPSMPSNVDRPALLASIPADGLLLIPESTNKRVMAFDPLTGDLVDADFIPADLVNLLTPIEAKLSPDGSMILVSDQVIDVVQSFDPSTGAFLGTFAPAGGVNTAILDNIRGIEFRPDGNLLVTVGGGANANAIAEFDSNGSYLGNFVATGGGGLGSPFDITAVVQPGGSLAAGDYLVAGIDSDAIHRFNSSGAPQSNLVSVDNFPEQVTQAANGNVLVANFSGSEEGILEYTSSGAFVGRYDPDPLSGYRGVYELPNGNLLVTTGLGVFEITRSDTLVRTVVGDVSARFISLVQGPVASSRATFAVTKLFTDGNPSEVLVSISCNTGLILDQSKLISEGEGVEFVITDFDSGELTCEITEDLEAGYNAQFFDGTTTNSTSCEFASVEWDAAYSCTITNTPSPVDIVVNKEWVIEGSSNDHSMEFGINLYCQAAGMTGPGAQNDGGNSWRGYDESEGDDSFVWTIVPLYPTSSCYAVEYKMDDAVEVDNGCGSLTASAGNGDECTITNTVFYEGIPTLNQYGVAMLALLMLSMGYVSLRRFI